MLSEHCDENVSEKYSSAVGLPKTVPSFWALTWDCPVLTMSDQAHQREVSTLNQNKCSYGFLRLEEHGIPGILHIKGYSGPCW